MDEQLLSNAWAKNELEGSPIIIFDLCHDVLLLVQVMDAQLTKIWHKGSGVVSGTHGINCHSAEIKVDTLVDDPQ